MDCSLFLQRYSDFRDELIGDPAVRRSMVDHLGRCTRCTRYHVRISQGTAILRTAPELEPSPGFRDELASRLGQSLLPAADGAEPIVPGPAGLMAGLMLVAALALLLLDAPAVTPATQARARPVGSVAAPRPVPPEPRPPFVSFATLEVPAFPKTRRRSDATPISLGHWNPVAP
ncbi:MAG: hypothetical protein ACE5PT_00065 [Gemmatimonadales bacterium]